MTEVIQKLREGILPVTALRYRSWCWRMYVGRKPGQMRNGQPVMCGHEAWGTVVRCDRYRIAQSIDLRELGDEE